MCINKVIIEGPIEKLNDIRSKLSLTELVSYDDIDFDDIDELMKWKQINWGVMEDIKDIKIELIETNLVIYFTSLNNPPIEAFNIIAEKYYETDIILYFINVEENLYGEVLWNNGDMEYDTQYEFDNFNEIDQDFQKIFNIKENIDNYNDILTNTFKKLKVDP